jgi:3-oxoacyl-[acyl-carrier-protein] synthase-3
MRFSKVAIAGLGHELPPMVMSSSDIEERLGPVYDRLGLHPGRLEMMTGIRERRYWAEQVTPSEVASRAGLDALEKSRIPQSKIGCIIHASVCRDFLEPATANVVHERLGLPARCQVFDVSNACLGVMSAMLMVANQIELGQIEAGIVVAGEIGRGLVERTIEKLLNDDKLTRKTIKSSIASLTIGSGAVAVVLANRSLVAKNRGIIHGATVRAASEYNRLCRGGGDGAIDMGVGAEAELEMSTDAEALLNAGIALAKANFNDFVEELSWKPEDIDKILTHQVGRAHQKALFDALALNEKRSFATFDFLGNIGSVSLPVTFALAADANFVRPGDHVALLGIGSGLSSVMMGVEW